MANEARPCPCDIGDRMEYGELGQEVQIEHFKAYLVKPSTVSEKAVIVIQDIFGWQLPNTRYMADMLAANGYTAVCPDFFLGKEPWSPSQDSSTFMAWLEDKKSTNINKEVDALLRLLVKQCGAKHIGVVGFCWGGAATHHIALHYPEVSAGVSFYGMSCVQQRPPLLNTSVLVCRGFLICSRPAGIVREGEDRYDLKSPTLFIFAENDNIIPLDQVSGLEAKLEEKCTVDYQVKVFPGQSHGFAHRKREDINPIDEPRIQEARADMINWLNKYI
ncbi:carboxymethylenebutenolidase homolog isoform X1 [Dunckerocampus dactyliophorus]|uniref:carboxymethylenebutenolidase homolog isoform X1 n=1 Tax=Dunckerocampus dactyliophorus TaxID=161453 RepID=UPI00240573FE|nr:carboxymethylenebutenolidase homolog isoform X1 [Dunckerocampus dactyliophorus]XP_054621073.1 carboxymethylenebutenolidase homolog isoform X1 [Dunckerocampus dactyliophorus]XP_054621074.1 carboxymethylenebutenolidase homolog isoform X1 [Dunckerocampus dactyliophorus]